jgi:chitin disaccharide deacetylase
MVFPSSTTISWTRQRWADYQFLTSPEAREIIEQQGIAVIDYRPIQQAWCQTMHAR